jgi:hypothetical protein
MIFIEFNQLILSKVLVQKYFIEVRRWVRFRKVNIIDHS